MKTLRTFTINHPNWVTVLFAITLYSFAKQSGECTPEHNSTLITSAITIAAIAVGYLTTCKSIIATRLGDKWMDIKAEDQSGPSLREELVRAFIDAIRSSISLIGLCVVVIVKGNASLTLQSSIAHTTFPWGELFILSLSFFLSYTLRASLVFNGFTIETCRAHDTDGAN
jgi:hypothetical protein